VWAETKYDGERAQIHVEVQSDGSSKITIFSKSKRDSTNDRHAIHSVIRSALRLDRCITDENPSRVKHNIILDAEMVAFKEGNIAGASPYLLPVVIHLKNQRILENKATS